MIEHLKHPTPNQVLAHEIRASKKKAERPSDAATCSPSSDTPETQRKIKRICGNWNNAGDRIQEFVLADVARKLERERDEARAMARDMRNQLEKGSRARLIFPWENAKSAATGSERSKNE